MKRRALFLSLLLSFLPRLPSACPPHLLLSFQCLSAEFSLFGESGERLAPKQNRRPGCFGAGTPKSNPHPSIWPPVGRRPKSSEMLLSFRKIRASAVGCPDSEHHAASGSTEHQVGLKAVRRTRGAACNCCKAANMKRPHRPDGSEMGGGGIFCRRDLLSPSRL